MNYLPILLACGLFGCSAPSPPPPSGGADAAGGGEGGTGGLSTGGGGGTGGSAPPGECRCEPVPECSDPSNFTDWCGGYGPGPFAATSCTGCAPNECAPQFGPLPACFASALWCCTYDFNPTPQPKTFYCFGGVACEVGEDVFVVLCEYDEDVAADSSSAAVLFLLGECRAKYPQYSCGLWDLTCF